MGGVGAAQRPLFLRVKEPKKTGVHCAQAHTSAENTLVSYIYLWRLKYNCISLLKYGASLSLYVH